MTGFQKMRAVLMMCAALGWWGIWFPELAVWTDVVCVVEDESKNCTVQQEEKVIECDSVREICDGLMRADKGQIQVKSRLLMLLVQHLQN